MSEPILVDDIDAAIESYKCDGYRLDMIFPADNPRVALMSKCGQVLNLTVERPAAPRTSRPARDTENETEDKGDVWVKGRAGMEYRDLIDDRLGGRAVLSHIRLTDGGDVADYVHYHKIDFQMIYCIKGRIKVVYEDQGEPFWLEAGDSVLQPPEIRHRVLECTAGSEVLELTMPAEHETWVDHEMSLPNARIDPEREFNGQKFVLTKGSRSQ